MAALAGIDLDRRSTRGANAVGIVRGLLVAFDHRQRHVGVAFLQSQDGGAEQRGFARTGAGHQIQRPHTMAVEMRAVLLCNLVVRTQHILLDADGTRLAQTRHGNAGGT